MILEIIGMGCRFPGDIRHPSDFWELLNQHRTAIREVSPSRWNPEIFVGGEQEPGKSVTSRAGWLSDIDRFDHGYFRISRKEAEEMEPPQRISLEVAIEALSDAQINPDALAGRRVGVFVGAGMAEGQASAFADLLAINAHTMSGNSLAMISNRISYFLDLKGPSVTVDTACSSALTALTFACQALASGECDLAVVIGVNVLLGPAPFIAFSKAQMLSKTGHSAPFDASANGFVRGEGCGAVILGRSDLPVIPLRRVYAEVVGWGINEDGKTPSITIPSGDSQRRLFERVVQKAGLEPDDFVYFEAHGTGTPVGDPIEARAISEGIASLRRTPLPVGSVKGHLGHLETAAGIAGLMKGVACLHHGRLVPTAGLTCPNPAIDAEKLNLRWVQQGEDLPRPSGSGRALVGVSSYGFGGANAFAILRASMPAEEGSPRETEEPSSWALPLSGHYQAGLEHLDQSFRERTERGDFQDALAWAGVGLPARRYRRVYVGGPEERLQEGTWRAEGEKGAKVPRVVFCFSGQGAQHPAMGTWLYRRFPAFRSKIDALDAAFERHSGYSLIRKHGFCVRKMSEKDLSNVLVGMPAIVLFQVAMTELLAEAGIVATVVMGHSTGEMAAAWASGALDLEGMCRLSHIRAIIQESMKPGAMVAWNAGKGDAEKTIRDLSLEGTVVVAATNTATSTTLSGDIPAIDALIAHGKAHGIRCARLPMPRAYHSHHLDEIEASIRSRLDGLESGACAIPFVSTVRGTEGQVLEGGLDGRYWWSNMANPVCFAEGCRKAAEQADVFLEIAPHSVLHGYIAENVRCDVLSTSNRKTPDDLSFLQVVGDLFVRGCDVRWSLLQAPRTFVQIPHVPWNHAEEIKSNATIRLGRERGDAAGGIRTHVTLSADRDSFLLDHTLHGQAVMPGAGYLALTMPHIPTRAIADVAFTSFLSLWHRDRSMDLRYVQPSGRWEWMSQDGTHMRCVPARAGAMATEENAAETKDRILERCGSRIDPNRYYAAVDRFGGGLRFGERFRSIEGIRMGDAEVLGEVRCRTDVSGTFASLTVLLDGCFQLLGCLKGIDSTLSVPVSIERIEWNDLAAFGSRVWCHARLTEVSDRWIQGDFRIFSSGWAELARVRGLRLERVETRRATNASLYVTRWQTLGIPKELRKVDLGDPTRALADLIQRLSPSSTISILDTTGDLARTLPGMLDMARLKQGAIYVAATGAEVPSAPGCFHFFASLADLPVTGFDVVFGSRCDDQLNKGGLRIPAGGASTPPNAASPADAASSPDAPARIFMPPDAFLAFPPTVTTERLADATVIVDCRSDLVEASTLLRTVVEAGIESTPIVWVIPEGGNRAPSPLWGFARAARNENKQLRIYAVGIPEAQDPAARVAIVEGLLQNGLRTEYELRWEDGTWLVPRLSPANLRPPSLPWGGFRVEVAQPGQISSLRWRPIHSENETLGPRDVRLAIGHVSMHFKDVMLAMDLLKGFKQILGMECSGVVTEIGPRVSEVYPGLKLGDRVLCLAMTTEEGEKRGALMATTAVVSADRIVPLPRDVREEEAAGFLGVYATAWHALHHVARLGRGETVLIHSAAGGVGLSAIQIACGKGARIVASAGSPEKAEYLRQHHDLVDILDSHRPEEFHARVMACTGNRGVDVVLNSLAGEGLVQSLKCLAPGGRHVEIGKRDILEDVALRLGALKSNITFHSVHLDILAETHPARVRSLLEECADRLSSGAATPIPTRVFPAEQAIEAFRLMSVGRHIGKIVIRIPEGFVPASSDPNGEPSDPLLPDSLFSGEETQLITGGTGGVGLALARLLARKGAGRILLVSRSGLPRGRAAIELEGIRKAYPHACFDVVTADVTDRGAVELLLAGEPRVSGIFHAATIYGSELSTAIDREAMKTWEVKVQGALNLSELSRGLALKRFVLLTSLAGLHGNANQAVYVAANAALHELARTRRRLGLPALAIDLPILLGAGRLSLPKNLIELELNTDRGFGAVSFHDIEPLLERYLAGPCEGEPVLSIDAPSWDAYWNLSRQRHFFKHLATRNDRTKGTADLPAGIACAPDAVAEQVKGKIAFLLSCRPNDIERDIPLSELGIDSLAAIELMNWTRKNFAVDVSQSELLSGFTPGHLIQRIVDRVAVTPPVAGGADEATRPAESPDQEKREPPPVTAMVVDAVEERRPPPVAPERSRESTPSSSPSGMRELDILPEAGLATGAIEITVEPYLTESFLDGLAQKLDDARQVIVLRGADAERFCLGMNLDDSGFGSEKMNQGLALFEKLTEKLNAARLPIVSVVDGACRGGGMVFPSLSSFVLATEQASFGFPEIRRGGLPCLVSVSARRRLSEAVCQRYMLSGDAFNASQAVRNGFADFAGSREEVEHELDRILRRFATIPADLLASCKAHCPSPSLDQALVVMGGLGRTGPADAPEEGLVRLRMHEGSGVAVLELNDPLHSNALDLPIARSMRNAVETLGRLEGLRAVVLLGTGSHFCVGVNPYSLMKGLEPLPVAAIASIVHEVYDAFVGLRRLGVPVLAAVQGKVLGGGLALMLNADYRICSPETVFHYGNLPRGVCPGLLLSENLERIVGKRWATELYLNDLTLAADQARRIGLVNRVEESPGEARRVALAMAEEIVRHPPVGIRETLALTRSPVDAARLARESVGMARCVASGGAFRGAWKGSEQPVDDQVLSGLFEPSEPPPFEGVDRRSKHAMETNRCPAPASVIAQDVGIIAMEMYTPVHTVSQKEMEAYRNEPGKYTAGLGQEAISFCGNDEDAVSMALTVVHRLMKRHGIDPRNIGRIEVGTESLTDRSKAIKTHLMDLFEPHGCNDIEGVDCYNACYGGTAALLNTVAWCQAPNWDGRLGLVVCVDIADLEPGQSFLNGAAAVAMLIGPRAPLVLLPERASFMRNTWDFYKPVGWRDPYPLMRDGKHSIDVYMSCLDGCQANLAGRLGGVDLLDVNDYFVFHCTSTYLCKRAFERVVRNSTSREMGLKARNELYQRMVMPGTHFTGLIGSTYTASCYVNLYSLLCHERERLAGRTICVFSYGSGAASSMYRLQARGVPKLDGSVHDYLASRRKYSPEAFVALTQEYSSSYGRFGFTPVQRAPDLPDVWYLQGVDEWGRRSYRLSESSETS